MRLGAILVFLALLVVSRSAPIGESPQLANLGDQTGPNTEPASESQSGVLQKTGEENTTEAQGGNEGDGTKGQLADPTPGVGDKTNEELKLKEDNSKQLAGPSPPPPGGVPQAPSEGLAQQTRGVKALFDKLPVGKLKVLKEYASPDKVKEFEAAFEELYEGDDDIKAFTLFDSLRNTNSFGIVSVMIDAAIKKKSGEFDEKPSLGSKESETQQNSGQEQGQQHPPPNQEGMLVSEKISIEDLIAALGGVPTVNLKRIQQVIHEGVDNADIKQMMASFQKGAAPKLTDDLIKFAILNLKGLLYSIDQILESREAKDSKIVTSPVGGKTPPAQTPPAANNTVATTLEKTEVQEPPKMGEVQEPPKTGEVQEPPKKGEVQEPLSPEGEEDEYEGLSEDYKDEKNMQELLNNNPPPKVSIPSDTNKNNGDKDQDEFRRPAIGADPPDVQSSDNGGGGGWFGMWHFLIVFLVIAGIVGGLYVCSHNRKKIREGVGSYIADAASRGRRNRNYRYKPVSST